MAQYTLPDLPYAHNALEPHIDARTMEIHHDKHHAAYVAKLNEALAGHPDLESKPVQQLDNSYGLQAVRPGSREAYLDLVADVRSAPTRAVQLEPSPGKPRELHDGVRSLANELHVDLKEVGLESRQQSEPCVARTEIVDGGLEAERPVGLDDLLQMHRICDTLVFG